MQRKQPSHILKIYEALGCIGDSRLQLVPSEDGVISAQVISSDRSKIYQVSYRQSDQSLISNDNSLYCNDEIGYPFLALLLFLDVLDYQSDYGEALSGITWKSISIDNNGSVIQQQIDKKLSLQGLDIDALHNYCDMLLEKLGSLGLQFST